MDTESIKAMGEYLANYAQQVLGYESAYFDRFSLSNYRTEFTLICDGEFLYIKGETVGEMWESIASKPNKKAREIQAMAEALTKVESIANGSELAAFSAILAAIQEPLDNMRKQITDGRGAV